MRQILRARIPASYAYGIGNIAWGGILIDILFRSKHLRGNFPFMDNGRPCRLPGKTLVFFMFEE